MLRFVSRAISAAVLLILTWLSMAIAKNLGSLAFPAYRTFSRNILANIASVTGDLPFALWEVLLVLLILLLIYSVIHMIRKKKILSWLSNMLLTASIFVFAFTVLWGLNHYAPPLAEELDLEIREYTKEELIDATEYYMEKAAMYASQVERTAAGQMITTDYDEWARMAGESYVPLAETWDVFSGSTAPVKKAGLTWYLMNKTGYTGVFVPFTAEATVNPDTFAASLPFTMCHEVAHRCGIAAEDEANFAAFLACSASTDPDFLYSGYYSAFIYCYNALYRTDSEAAQALWQEEHALLRQECNAANDHYAQHEGTVQDIAQKANDTYLKTFSEESGVQSYGEAADYLISYYLKNNI